MKQYNEIPPITVYSPDRRTSYGVITEPLNFTKDVRFNSASEVNFTVANKYYDHAVEKWISNPIYNQLIEDNLLYIPDDTAYFNFPIREVGDENFYTLSPPEDFSVRKERKDNFIGQYSPSVGYNNFSLQKETELFDIGSKMGYNFEAGAYLSDSGQFYNNVQNSRFWRLSTCKQFIPIEYGDIVYLDSNDTDSETGDESWIFSYRHSFYSDIDPIMSVYTTSGTLNEYIPRGIYTNDTMGKHGMLQAYETNENGSFKNYLLYEYGLDNSGEGNSNYIQPGYKRYRVSTRIPVSNKNIKFARFSLYTSNNFASPAKRLTYYPKIGYIKVFSGERRCNRIANSLDDGIFAPKLKWFVITNIEEQDDGISKTKTVTAFSYEYVLSKKTFSIQSNTLALYVPPAIVNLVQSNKWIVDKTKDLNGNISYVKHPQRMQAGLLNQILEYLPGWKIGNVSNELMTRFRTIDEVDNANVYSFCMNDIQQAYQCYIIFDTENLTINAYTHYDANSHSSPLKLTWDNAIKNVQVTNTDTSYVTALRIHTANDQYSVGLINPTGDNIIYDFSHIEDKLDYVVDISKNRTLKQALSEWKTKYVASKLDYRTYAQTLITSTLKEIQLKSRMSQVLGDYTAKGEIINLYLSHDYEDSNQPLPSSYIIGDVPRTSDSMITGVYAPTENYGNYYSETLYRELLSLATTYEEVKAEYQSNHSQLIKAQNDMKAIASKLSLQYHSATSDSILSKQELIALDPYIKEGDWTNDNVIFSETYSSDDIFNTLVDVYDEAKFDLENRLNKPQYEFSLDLINPLHIPEFQKLIQQTFVGGKISIEVCPGVWIYPTLLEMHIDYKSNENTMWNFSTDYHRRPLQNRFADLFRTITQTSIKESTFTFNE